MKGYWIVEYEKATGCSANPSWPEELIVTAYQIAKDNLELRRNYGGFRACGYLRDDARVMAIENCKSEFLNWQVY